MRYARFPVPLLVIATILALGVPSLQAADGVRTLQPPGGMPPEKDLEAVLGTWLETGDDLHAAWAGWNTAERRLEGLEAAVRQRLVGTAPSEGGPRDPRFFLEMVLLDALIRLDATAPPATLMRLAGPHAESVVTLLCRRPAFEQIHLRVFEALEPRLGIERWVALGNKCLAWRAPGFAALVLGHQEIHRLVRVWDSDPPYPPFRGPGDSVPG